MNFLRQAFLSKYGTHYVTSAVFGGSVNVWVSASQSFYHHETSTLYYEESESALDLLFFKFGRYNEYSHNTSSISKAFKQNASVLLESLGGDPTAISTNNFSNWAKNVYLAPVPINVTYGKLSDLVRNPVRRQLLDEAIDEYLAANKKNNNDHQRTTDQSSSPTPSISSQYYATCAAPPGRKISLDALTPKRHSDSISDVYFDVDSFPVVGTDPCQLSQGHQFGGKMVSSSSANSVADCCAQCRRHAGCSFFDFDTLENTCRMLSSKSSDTVALMHVSGAPNPSAPPSPSPVKPAPVTPKPSPSPSAPTPSPEPSPSPTPKYPTLPTLQDLQSSNVLVGRFFSGGSGAVGIPAVGKATFQQSQVWTSPVAGAPVPVFAVPDGFRIVSPASNCLKARAHVIAAGADVVQQQLLAVPGVEDISVDQVTGQPTTSVVVDQARIARYGVAGREVLDFVEAIGGIRVGEVYEGQRVFPLVVRLPDRFRADSGAIAAVRLPTLGGASVPVSALADVRTAEAASTINREWGRRLIRVQCNVGGRDPASFVAEAQARVAANVALPEGYVIEWGGQFENLQRAQLRLAVVVPVVLLLVFVLLYFSLKRVRDVLIIYSGIPLAAVGAIVALWLRGIPFSVSAAVGFIALTGIAVLNGQILIEAIREQITTGKPVRAAVIEAAKTRLRPVLATGITDAVGFFPMAISTGVGSEVQRPLATVVIGGIVTSTLLTLVVLPALYATFGDTGPAGTKEVESPRDGEGAQEGSS